jgi:hypothetical protein
MSFYPDFSGWDYLQCVAALKGILAGGGDMDPGLPIRHDPMKGPLSAMNLKPFA